MNTVEDSLQCSVFIHYKGFQSTSLASKTKAQAAICLRERHVLRARSLPIFFDSESSRFSGTNRHRVYQVAYFILYTFSNYTVWDSVSSVELKLETALKPLRQVGEASV